MFTNYLAVHGVFKSLDTFQHKDYGQIYLDKLKQSTCMLTFRLKKNDKNLTLNFWSNISRCCGAPETCLMGPKKSQTKLSLCATQNQAKRIHSDRTLAINASIFFNEALWLAPLDPQNVYRLLRGPAVLFSNFYICCTDGNGLSTCSNHPMSVNSHTHHKRSFLA